jgi:ATP-dependent DNA helicase DinG
VPVVDPEDLLVDADRSPRPGPSGGISPDAPDISPTAGSPAASPAAHALALVTGRLTSGEVRAPQVAMCDAVAAAVANRRHLVVQAGTGTGKSLAYLVPAALSGRKVVVATATKALQDQLAKKDLPLVQAALAPEGHRFSFAVLKGRANYLCRQRVAEMSGDAEPAEQQAFDDAAAVAPPDDAPAADAPGAGTDAETPTRLAEQVLRLVRWAEETDSGDQAELDFEPHPHAWAAVSVGPRECPGAFHCPSGSTCFAEAARGAAARADIVVVNTHLYGSHLASGYAVLAEHDVVVFDEAHALEDVMTACLGVEVTAGRLRALATASRGLVADAGGGRARRGRATSGASEAVEAVTAAALALDGALAARLGERVLADDESGPSAADAALGDALSLAAQRVRALLAELRADAARGPSLPLQGGDLGREEPRVDETGRRARALSAAGHLLDDLDRIAARRPEDVAWVDGTPRAPVLRVSPVDVGTPLADILWPEVTAVLTSATIPIRLAERLGLERGHAAEAETGGRGGQPEAQRADPGVDELDVGSPFDYRSQALLYVARHLPDRASAAAEAAIHDELELLINAAGGRTLALFTSRRAMEAATLELRSRLDMTVLMQDDFPKPRLLREFAEDEAACLFATIGLWQGVDVMGPALSLVTVDRLPFARPDDPLMQARRDRAGPAAFRTVDLPRAATMLAQGAGRLIRSATDHGVVAVLDPRLATAGYRGVLLAGMPPMRRTTDRRQVVDFLRRILPAGAPDGAAPAQ